MEVLIAQINNYYKLTPDEEELLRQNVRMVYFPKDTAVVETGKVDDSVYFIRKGVWRAYSKRNGEQITLWFAVPGETILSPWGYGYGKPSRYTISASCDSSALELRNSTIQKLIDVSSGFSRWLHHLLIETICNNDDLLVDIALPKAEKRYLAFMNKMPEIFQNVPLKEIAGFIGVTPQSLSRIRAGLVRKAKNE